MGNNTLSSVNNATNPSAIAIGVDCCPNQTLLNYLPHNDDKIINLIAKYSLEKNKVFSNKITHDRDTINKYGYKLPHYETSKAITMDLNRNKLNLLQ